MNWILCPIRNGREMTRAALRTFLAQDIGDVGVLFIANAPDDGTLEMLSAYFDPRVHVSYRNPPLGVAASWNAGLKWIWAQGAQYALVVNNDVELHPQTYRLLVEDGGPFVTAVGVKERAKYEAWCGTPVEPKRPHPDFSAYLIRREVWDKVGKFDEDYEGAYAEDSAYHLRMHRAEIHAYCLDLPFLHHACGTIKNASPQEATVIQERANRNRERFKAQHGVEVGSPEYYKLFNSTAPEAQPEPSAGAPPSQASNPA